MNTLVEFTRLALHRPGPDAGPEVVAEWYRAKGQLLTRLAGETDLEASELATLAAAAYAHAHGLRPLRDLQSGPNAA